MVGSEHDCCRCAAAASQTMHRIAQDLAQARRERDEALAAREHDAKALFLARQLIEDHEALGLRRLTEAAALRAQRDEARELVRRVVMWAYDELSEEQARNAIARWDEEAKR